MTIKFWGVFLDETGCEFGAEIVARTKAEAWELARDEYPESRCVQMESPEDTRAREQRLYESVAQELDGDDYYDDYEDDEDDDWDDLTDEERDEIRQSRAERAEAEEEDDITGMYM